MEKPKARLTIEQHQQAINEAIWIDASPLEWPTLEKVPLLCNALLDSVVMVDYLMKRLATAEAERDAARGASEKDREWVGRALDKQREYLEQCQALIAERDTAQSGEARAKALCHKASQVLRWCFERIDKIDPIGGMEGFPEEFGGVGFDAEIEAMQGPALAWLAEQRAELLDDLYRQICAAAVQTEEVKGLGFTWSDAVGMVADRAAALRAGATGGADA